MILLTISSAWAATNPRIVVYAGGNRELTDMLAGLIENDTRIEAHTLTVSTPQAVSLAAALPNIKCLVIYADNWAHLTDLDQTLIPFFREGGGLVGLTEACFEPSAGALAQRVFPVNANATEKELSPRERRTRTYVLEEGMDIASGLPDSFEVLSMGTYYCADEDGEYLEIPGDHTVVYSDAQVGCPLLVTHESSRGGRSVALPGIMVVNVPRVDVYYGNLARDENFVRLFTNSVLWASTNTRSQFVESDLEQGIEDTKERYEELKEDAERSREKREARRLATLAALWGLGIAFCVAVVWKLMLGNA